MFPTSPAPSENRRAQASRPQQGGNRAALAPASAGYTQGMMYAGNPEMLAPPYTVSCSAVCLHVTANIFSSQLAQADLPILTQR